ncbi:phosphotransferase [Actinomadura montaniterrae]|uniref:phosphotransferase n=1 Tax=Actinomadura montaniterrae TaxID=1803903 RepID=UPI001CEF9ACF
MRWPGDQPHRGGDCPTVDPGVGGPAPRLVAVDPTAAHCEYPSLLMTHLPGRTVLDDEGLGRRIPQLARQLVAIHTLRMSGPAGAGRGRERATVLANPGRAGILRRNAVGGADLA